MFERRCLLAMANKGYHPQLHVEEVWGMNYVFIKLEMNQIGPTR